MIKARYQGLAVNIINFTLCFKANNIAIASAKVQTSSLLIHKRCGSYNAISLLTDSMIKCLTSELKGKKLVMRCGNILSHCEWTFLCWMLKWVQSQSCYQQDVTEGVLQLSSWDQESMTPLNEQTPDIQHGTHPLPSLKSNHSIDMPS